MRATPLTMSEFPVSSSPSSQRHRQQQQQQQQHQQYDDDTEPSSAWYEVEQNGGWQEPVDGMLGHRPSESTETEMIENQLLELASSPRSSQVASSPIAGRVIGGGGGKSATADAVTTSRYFRGESSNSVSITTDGEEESQGPPRSIIRRNDRDYDEESVPIINLDSMERSEPKSEASSLNPDASHLGGRPEFSTTSASDGKSWLNIDSTSSSKGSQGSYADQVPALSGSHSTTNLVLKQPLGQQPLYHDPPPTPSPKKRAVQPPIINLVDPYPDDPMNIDADHDVVDLGAKSQKSDLDDILGPNGEPFNSDLDDILGPQDGGVQPKHSEHSDSLESTLGPYMVSDAAETTLATPYATAGTGKEMQFQSVQFQSEYTHFASSSNSELNDSDNHYRQPPLSIVPPYSSYYPAEATTRTHATYDNTTFAGTPSQTRRAINAISKSLADRDAQSSVWSPTTAGGPSILPEASTMLGGEASTLLREDTSTAYDTACEDSATNFTYSETPVTSGGEATNTTRSHTHHTTDTHQTQRTNYTASSQPSSSVLLMELPSSWDSKVSQPSAGHSGAGRSPVWASSVAQSSSLADGTSRGTATDHTRATLSPTEHQSTSTHPGDEVISQGNQSSMWEESSRGDSLSPGTSTGAEQSRSSRTRDFAISPATSTSRGDRRKPNDTLSPESSSAYSQSGTLATSSRGVDTFSQGIDTYSHGDTLSPSTRASGTLSPGESTRASGTLSPGESSHGNPLDDQLSAMNTSSRGGTFSPTERSSRGGFFTPTERSSRAGTFSPTERSSRVGTFSPSESSRGTATLPTYGSEADGTRATASNISHATSGETLGSEPEASPSRHPRVATRATAAGVVSMDPPANFGDAGDDYGGTDGGGGRMWHMAELQAQTSGDKPLNPRAQKFAESIMARTRSRADPDAVVDNASTIGEIERPQSMINLSVQDEGFLIENTALARKRVRVVQLLTIGLAAFLVAFLGGFWVQSSCHFLSAVVQVGQNAEVFHLRFGLWKYSPVDSAFQGYTYCSPYDGNLSDSPWFGRSASLLALLGGAFALGVLWVYLVLGRCRRDIWKAAVISAAGSGALQLSALSIFAGPVCRQGECTLGPAGVLSIVASCVYFILAFEMHYNTPLVALPDGISPVASRDQPHNLMANLEMTDFEYGAKAYVHRLRFGESNAYPSLNQYQRQHQQPIGEAMSDRNLSVGSYKPPAVIV